MTEASAHNRIPTFIALFIKFPLVQCFKGENIQDKNGKVGRRFIYSFMSQFIYLCIFLMP